MAGDRVRIYLILIGYCCNLLCHPLYAHVLVATWQCIAMPNLLDWADSTSAGGCLHIYIFAHLQDAD